MVDGVEANRATVSASAVQEVRINQDPSSTSSIDTVETSPTFGA